MFGNGPASQKSVDPASWGDSSVSHGAVNVRLSFLSLMSRQPTKDHFESVERRTASPDEIFFVLFFQIPTKTQANPINSRRPAAELPAARYPALPPAQLPLLLLDCAPFPCSGSHALVLWLWMRRQGRGTGVDGGVGLVLAKAFAMCRFFAWG